MSIPRRKDLDRILQTNSPRCPSCTDRDFDFFLYVQRIHTVCAENILYVQRTYCMCREYILYVQRIHISQNNIFSKNNILYIFPKPVDPQNFRSSISPNSRARGAGIHTKTCGTSNILERISSLFSTNSGESSYCIFRRKTSKNTQSHRPTKMWNEYNVFLKNTLLKNSVYYI